MAAVVASGSPGQTINLMTLADSRWPSASSWRGTVEIENNHTQMAAPLDCPGRCGWEMRKRRPRLLAMVCILACSSRRFMQGAPRRCSCPCRWPSVLDGGFLSPVEHVRPGCLRLAVAPVRLDDEPPPVWGRPARAAPCRAPRAGLDTFLRSLPARVRAVAGPSRPLPLGPRDCILLVCAAIIWGLGTRLAWKSFPTIDTGQFRLRIHAPDGTDIDHTEQIVLTALEVIRETAGANHVQMTLGYLGHDPLHLSDQCRVPMDARAGRRGDVGRPEEGERHPGRALKRSFAEDSRRRCRACISPSSRPTSSRGDELRLAHAGRGGRQWTGFRPNPPLRRQAHGRAGQDSRHSGPASRPVARLSGDPSRRRSQKGGDRVRHAQRRRQVAAEVTSSSRFTVPNYWADPKTGIGYQCSGVPRPVVRSPKGIKPVGSIGDLKMVPVSTMRPARSCFATWLRSPRNHARRNRPLQHEAPVSMAANIAGTDLGSVAREVGERWAVRGSPRASRSRTAGRFLRCAKCSADWDSDWRGHPRHLLLLSANFQSLRLPLVTISTAPRRSPVLVLMLFLTIRR